MSGSDVLYVKYCLLQPFTEMVKCSLVFHLNDRFSASLGVRMVDDVRQLAKMENYGSMILEVQLSQYPWEYF